MLIHIPACKNIKHSPTAHSMTRNWPAVTYDPQPLVTLFDPTPKKANESDSSLNIFCDVCTKWKCRKYLFWKHTQSLNVKLLINSTTWLLSLAKQMVFLRYFICIFSHFFRTFNLHYKDGHYKTIYCNLLGQLILLLCTTKLFNPINLIWFQKAGSICTNAKNTFNCCMEIHWNEVKIHNVPVVCLVPKMSWEGICRNKLYRDSYSCQIKERFKMVLMNEIIFSKKWTWTPMYWSSHFHYKRSHH